MRARTAATRAKAAPGGAGQVRAYIDAAPVPARAMLRQLRSLVRTTVPDAEEKLSYGMPYYGLHGRLMYFAAFRSHVSVFLMGRSKDAFAAETARWRTTANTMRFEFGERLPVTLLRRILRARAKESRDGAAAKASGGARHARAAAKRK